MTFDNGKEFSEHERIAYQGIATSSFEHIIEAQIRAIEDNLNNRPRKSLGWHTPSEVMAGFLTVALAS